MDSLMQKIQERLKALANIQINHLTLCAIVLLLFTLFAVVGSFNITLQSDLSKLDPQDIPVTQLRNKINTEFNQFESVVILIEIDEEYEGTIDDIRDPAVIEFIKELDTELRKEITIQSVSSIAELFPQKSPSSLTEVKQSIKTIPEFDQFFGGGYAWTVILIDADVGGDDQKIKALNNRIDEIIQTTSVPGGLKITTTGDAPLNSSIFTLLINDSYFTLIFATVLIFILLLILERSIKQGIIILLPLTFGLIWTLGTMGWLGIPITIATAAMGAMLLGLGVEYSIFMYERYKEEREKYTAEKALEEAIATVGATIVSSGTTTLIGFFALSLSLFPVLSDLGLTLGIGIGYMLLATILVFPIVALIDEKIEQTGDEIKKKRKPQTKFQLAKIYDGYATFVSKKPKTTLLLSIIVTIIMIIGMQQIRNQDVTFETILPEDLEAIKAYIKLTDYYGDDSTILIYVVTDPQSPGSNEPQDIRDPRIIEYIDVLSQKAKTAQNVVEVSSVADMIKGANSGDIPDTIASQKEVFEQAEQLNLINKEYSATLVRISVSEDAIDDSEEVVAQIKRIITETEKPAGVTTQASGGLVVQSELDALNAPDSQRTSMIAFAGIIVFLLIITLSIRSTILPLVTVALSIIWILGLTGFFRVPFNNITQSVLTMIIGIGIDFGLQVVNRFNQELERFDKQTAMKETLKNVLAPMVITVLAALIGFRAMALGQLKVMADLGTLMSFGIASSMVIAVSFVASITLLTQRKQKKKKASDL